MLPRLKSLNVLASGTDLLVSLDPKVRVRLADPDGSVLALLRLLQDGSRTPDELAASTGRRRRDPGARPARPARLAGGRVARRRRSTRTMPSATSATSPSSTRSRRCRCPRDEPQERLRAAHVLVLGAGGLGSAVLMNLAGLGVGALTVVDQDLVELRNFARQFTYTEASLGAAEGRPRRGLAARVRPVACGWRRTGDASSPRDDVADLIRATNPDLVVSAIDEPDEVDRWVNAACVAARRAVRPRRPGVHPGALLVRRPGPQRVPRVPGTAPRPAGRRHRRRDRRRAARPAPGPGQPCDRPGRRACSVASSPWRRCATSPASANPWPPGATSCSTSPATARRQHRRLARRPGLPGLRAAPA